jgi:hypothetical protein
MAQDGSSSGDTSMELAMELEYNVMDVSGSMAKTDDHTTTPPLHHPTQRPHAAPFCNDTPPSARVPERTDSGESQRSQTRRFAAGHAEMQRSAFLSSQNYQEECKYLQQVPKKIKAEVAALDSSKISRDNQPQKRPRRLVHDPHHYA